MQWFDRWGAISRRISGLVEAARIFAGVPQAQALYENVVGDGLIPEARALQEELRSFRASYPELPADAVQAIDAFLGQQLDTSMNVGRLHGITYLVLLQSRLEYAIADTEVFARSTTELAIEHLRRSIVANPTIAAAWRSAFKESEPACEKLGAAHILGHGIWAFKVNAQGGATDLVFAEPVDEAKANRVARALVLTEWKKATAKNVADKAAEAREQASLYTRGVLGGLELKRTRYVVLVTEKEIVAPADVREGDVTYRHVVVPVKPDTPSVAANTLAGAKKRAAKKTAR
jgi:hypothetical protein